eukprot:scaffold31671_cov57-Phaeocystis_antarctica.AAC.2
MQLLAPGTARQQTYVTVPVRSVQHQKAGFKDGATVLPDGKTCNLSWPALLLYFIVHARTRGGGWRPTPTRR